MKAKLNRDESETMAQVLINPECRWEKDTAAKMTKLNINHEDRVANTMPKQ